MLNHTTRVINAYNETKNPKNLRFVCVFAMMTLSVTARARFGSSFPVLHGGCLSTYTLKSHLDKPTHQENGRLCHLCTMCDEIEAGHEPSDPVSRIQTESNVVSRSWLDVRK